MQAMQNSNSQKFVLQTPEYSVRIQTLLKKYKELQRNIKHEMFEITIMLICFRFINLIKLVIDSNFCDD